MKTSTKGHKLIFFVFVYTLIPVPTTPLFTTIAVAKIKPMIVIPPFFVGKFISDMMMVYAGKYAADNAVDIFHGLLNWKTVCGAFAGIVLIGAILFIDWNTLLIRKKLKLNFRIWK